MSMKTLLLILNENKKVEILVKNFQKAVRKV